jgi:hypothetical protein
MNDLIRKMNAAWWLARDIGVKWAGTLDEIYTQLEARGYQYDGEHWYHAEMKPRSGR